RSWPPAGRRSKSDAAMIRKGGITRIGLHRRWPHHVALSADKVRGLNNSQVVRGFADMLSVARLTHSVSRADVDLVVFYLANRRTRARSPSSSAGSGWEPISGPACPIPQPPHCNALTSANGGFAFRLRCTLRLCGDTPRPSRDNALLDTIH